METRKQEAGSAEIEYRLMCLGLCGTRVPLPFWNKRSKFEINKNENENKNTAAETSNDSCLFVTFSFFYMQYGKEKKRSRIVSNQHSVDEHF